VTITAGSGTSSPMGAAGSWSSSVCLGFRLNNLESLPRFEVLEDLSFAGSSEFFRFPKKAEGLLMELPMFMLYWNQLG
jgi:hypothetical protein